MTLDFLFRRILRRGLLQEEKVRSLCKKISLYLRSWSLAFREKDFRDHNVPGGEGLQTSDIIFFVSNTRVLIQKQETKWRGSAEANNRQIIWSTQILLIVNKLLMSTLLIFNKLMLFRQMTWVPASAIAGRGAGDGAEVGNGGD